MKRRETLITVIIGLFAGAVNGFFGSGGGVIAVSALTLICSYTQKEAQATTLGAMLALSAISIAVYFFSGVETNASAAIYTAIGAAAGGLLGAALFIKLSNKTVKLIFAAMLIFAGIKTLIA